MCVDCGAGKLPHPPGADGGRECAGLDVGICTFMPPSTMAASYSLCVRVCAHWHFGFLLGWLRRSCVSMIYIKSVSTVIRVLGLCASR